jgi:glutamine cyclotransferase
MKKILAPALLAIYMISSCKDDKKSISILSPEAGSSVRSGEKFTIDVDFADQKIDSVVYLLDSTVISRKQDTSSVSASTAGIALGNHLVTARIYIGGTPQEQSSNIVVLTTNQPQPYTFAVVNTYPHDTTSYVEGLEYHDGLLYESDGGKDDSRGGSSLRVVKPETGKIIKQVDIKNYFAEGITVIGNKIIQLTYTEGIGFVYDKSSLNKLSEFPYTAGREGWGLTFDGQHILNTDGSNSIYFLNKDTYQKERTIEVYDNNGPVDNLNELEFINGKIYANVYTKPWILIINPLTGAVEGKADLTQLLPKGDDSDYVLNGIAWDAKGKRLFVTGKWWDKLYEIKLAPVK